MYDMYYKQKKRSSNKKRNGLHDIRNWVHEGEISNLIMYLTIKNIIWSFNINPFLIQVYFDFDYTIFANLWSDIKPDNLLMCWEWKTLAKYQHFRSYTTGSSKQTNNIRLSHFLVKDDVLNKT